MSLLFHSLNFSFEEIVSFRLCGSSKVKMQLAKFYSLAFEIIITSSESTVFAPSTEDNSPDGIALVVF